MIVAGHETRESPLFRSSENLGISFTESSTGMSLRVADAPLGGVCLDRVGVPFTCRASGVFVMSLMTHDKACLTSR